MAVQEMIQDFSDDVVSLQNAPRIGREYKNLVSNVACFWFNTYHDTMPWKEKVISSNEETLFENVIYIPSNDEIMSILGFAFMFNNLFTEDHENVDDVIASVMRSVYSDAYDVLLAVAHP